MKRVLGWVVVMAVLLICLFLLLIKSCGNTKQVAELRMKSSKVHTENVSLIGELAKVQLDIADAKAKSDELLKDKAALQEKSESFAQENMNLAEQAQKSRADKTWWFNQAEKLKGFLAVAEEANKKLGGQIGTLEGEKDKLQGEYDGLVAEKTALGEKLAVLQDKANAGAEEAQATIAELERKLKQTNERVGQLEIKIAASERELAELKNRALSTEEKTAKKRAAADSFKIYVVLTAVSPDLNLNEEIRALAAEILPKMYSVSDDELYRIAEPIMARMPQQDDVKSVPLLHAAWKRWQEARTLYSKFKPEWLKKKGEASS